MTTPRLNAQQQADLKELEALEAASTKRPCSPELEAKLYKVQPVLDHGFVRVVDYMGDDAAIVQAARVSYGRGTRSVSSDAGLIKYLMRHRHSTPFEMCEIKFHIKLPVFVARQWIRHRTANVNEISARYSVLDQEFYLPAPEHLAAQSAVNRQGRGSILEGQEAEQVMAMLKDEATSAYDQYMWLLNEDDEGNPADESRSGLARELARMRLPLNVYTQWYWKVDLHNLFHFLALRADPHAQYEIRAYADVMIELVKAWVPLATDAFEDYRMGSFTLSAKMCDVVRRMVSGEDVTLVTSGLSAREWTELNQAVLK